MPRPTKDSVWALLKQHFPEMDNKVGHAFSGAMVSVVSAWKKELDAENKAKGKEGATASSSEAIERFLDTPMSHQERSRYIQATMDAELEAGASVKEIVELSKAFGIGQTEDTEIIMCDFETAFPDLHTAKEVATQMIKEQMK